MTASAAALQHKLTIAGILLASGLAVEGITLLWAHPLSFLLFCGLGGALVLAGIAVYLFAIVNR